MKKTLFEYRGANAHVTYDLSRCIHAGECVRSLPSVFDSARSPWVDPDGAPVGALVEAVARCPSGALQIARPDGDSLEPTPSENVVQLTTSGPLHLRGRIAVRDPSGEPVAETTRLALCRCGASNAKPFCDMQHASTGFADGGELGTGGGPPDDAVGEVLEITPRPNGPYLLKGRFRIVSASGRSSEWLGKAALCRCGGSANKPFCDGTHGRIGFDTAGDLR